MGHPLEVSVAALKSLVADYALRTRQAEEMASRMMRANLSDQERLALFEVVKIQMEARAKDRAVHQQAVIQATLFALESALSQDSEQLRKAVIDIHRELVVAADAANAVPVDSTATSK